ncbi:hypothetical protein OAJ50_05040 [Candidatus Nitrosopelagicus sp.]|nr:hypothetical protein [Candidatus Nitrosopelagicus sp.]
MSIQLLPLVTGDKGPNAPKMPKMQFTLGDDNFEKVINPHHIKGQKTARKYICSVGKCSGVDV